jgi:cytoskeleton protein RodZ
LDNTHVATGIGERLREARSARGIELEEVQERTRIRTRYLRAMEEERWELLPAAAYARGFLHTYAELLGLDAEALVEEYRRRHESQEAEPEPEPVPQVATATQRVLGLPGHATGGLRPGRRTIAAIAVATLLGVVLVLELTGGSGKEAGQPTESATPAASAPAGAPAKPPSRITLRLTTTGTVWVCLVEQGGRPLIEGVTLPGGEKQGPFRARAFEITLGNGQVEMTANGKRVPVPALAEPLGYRVTPERTRELAPSARPTCT